MNEEPLEHFFRKTRLSSRNTRMRDIRDGGEGRQGGEREGQGREEERANDSGEDSLDLPEAAAGAESYRGENNRTGGREQRVQVSRF